MLSQKRSSKCPVIEGAVLECEPACGILSVKGGDKGRPLLSIGPGLKSKQLVVNSKSSGI